MGPVAVQSFTLQFLILHRPPAMAYLVATKVLCQDGHKAEYQRVRVELRITRCVEMK